MLFKYVANACGLVEGHDGTKILFDPWIEDGVFEGSWCHCPPLRTTIDDFRSIDAIYISHIHSDHFDTRNFNFDLNIPIFVLDKAPNFLIKKLLSMGFYNLVKVKDWETVTFNELEVTLFAPFAKEVFHPARVGNLIDSAILIKDGRHQVLNANDNMLTTNAAREIFARFGPVDVALLKYGYANAYPACYSNLTDSQKVKERKRLLDRNFKHLGDCLDQLHAKSFVPFAGSYVLGGRLSYLNRYLSGDCISECGDIVKQLVPQCEFLPMVEGQVIDVATLQILDRGFINENFSRDSYIRDVLSNREYDYDMESEPNKAELLDLLEKSYFELTKRVEKLGLDSKTNLYIESTCNLRVQLWPVFKLNPDINEPFLRCRIDAKLLFKILDRRAQWDDATVGCHITFDRKPNRFDPDLHTILQLAHP